MGDLHGCFNLLVRLLVDVQFNPDQDRLFSVGDLIDRGPYSLRCLQLLQEPWFFAVQGNHELMLRKFFADYLLTGQLESLDDVHATGFLFNGGGWVEAYYQADQQCMSAEFNRCLTSLLDVPLIWIVGTGAQRFHIVHGELIRPDHSTATCKVWLDSDLDQWLINQSIASGVEDYLYWGRTLMSYYKKSVLCYQPNLSTTFCGHSYDSRPRQVLSHLCIDTGAFLSQDPAKNEQGYSLTLYNVNTSCWVSASYQQNSLIKGCF